MKHVTLSCSNISLRLKNNCPQSDCYVSFVSCSMVHGCLRLPTVRLSRRCIASMSIISRLTRRGTSLCRTRWRSSVNRRRNLLFPFVLQLLGRRSRAKLHVCFKLFISLIIWSASISLVFLFNLSINGIAQKVFDYELLMYLEVVCTR